MSNMAERWDKLPHWVKVIPYIAGAGAITAIIQYLAELEVNDAVLLGLINIIIVFLKEILGKIRK